ncbi:hypothetical protein CJP74_03890 [Psittacicella melopsittaci]|uniref:Luciferase-like domain-containing protein n=1 Tax=Psittacicella melopsittaci TaxID=2028576 RepID=A0A3A1Y921_9GAMM|nr:TIGR03571 family LLM class oxidoreductase [Psittacicella melopsittaci]RIY32634.1 hypothetical protein CJP74_03890 [Psittacicella melopsittaci]
MTRAKLQHNLENNRAFTRVFQPNKLTVGIMAPFSGYLTPFPDLSQQEKLLKMIDNSPIAAIWARDVPFYDPTFGDVGQGTDPLVTLGWYTALTKNVTLGSAGIVTTLRNPIHTAKAAASLDLLSSGRFILGLATGDRPAEYAAFGEKFVDRSQRYRETWNIIQRIQQEKYPQFTTESYGKFSGDLDFYPKPEHHIPMITIGQARQDVAWIGQNADAWLTYGLFNEPERMRQTIRSLAQAAPHKWTPFGTGTFLELEADDDAPLLMGPVYIKTGSKALVKVLQDLEELGVNHIVFNLKPTRDLSQEQALEKIINLVSVHFPHH